MSQQGLLFALPLAAPLGSDEAIPALEDLLATLKRAAPPGSEVRIRPENPNNHIANDCYNTWEACLAAGRDYLVGSKVQMAQFLHTHTSSLNDWQRAAYPIAWYHPVVQVIVNTGRYGPRHYDWVVYRRGEYVDFSLPHHDAGGERDYISRDGRTRVLINID